MLPKPKTCEGCSLYEAPYGKAMGFSLPDGNGEYGCLIVAEALGADEEIEGKGLVGRSGHFYFSELARVGLERDKFTIFNTIACRPPDNKLVKQPYEKLAIAHCAPNLDKVIDHARAQARAYGKTFTILTLGRTAFKRVMGYEDKGPIMALDYLCYPHWNERYGAWVVASDHPAYLVRGSTHLVPVMTFAAQRAVEIGASGVAPDVSIYLEDPPPAVFAQWVADYKRYRAINPSETYLSYDIETPYKLKKRNEDEMAKEEGEDYTILRCSFSYIPGHAISVPWSAQYMPWLEELFNSQSQMVGWNSENFDWPRIAHQIPVSGDNIDGMLAWHVLNSSLPKSLGFVTPFYVHNATIWKHEATNRPAWYNCRDADYALQCFLGIQRDLKAAHLWDEVFKVHVIEAARVLAYMSGQGVVLDATARDEAEVKVGGMLEEIEASIEHVVPIEARELKVYQKTPADTSGMVQVQGSVKTTQCPKCGAMGVKADHFKSVGVKKLKGGAVENVCVGLKSIKVSVVTQLWALPQPFKISKVSMLRYQSVMRHQPIIDTREKKVTFDEKAIERLQKLYPLDTLYPLILEQRSLSKLLGTYIGRREMIEVEVPNNYVLQSGERFL